jgi:hypothetical protein
MKTKQSAMKLSQIINEYSVIGMYLGAVDQMASWNLPLPVKFSSK